MYFKKKNNINCCLKFDFLRLRMAQNKIYFLFSLTPVMDLWYESGLFGSNHVPLIQRYFFERYIFHVIIVVVTMVANALWLKWKWYKLTSLFLIIHFTSCFFDLYLTMSTPFDIPELKYHIEQFLNKNQLAVCARVCKSWNQLFTPAL